MSYGEQVTFATVQPRQIGLQCNQDCFHCSRTVCVKDCETKSSTTLPELLQSAKQDLLNKNYAACMAAISAALDEIAISESESK